MMIFGNGEYYLQPIYVDDFAKLAVEQGGKTENAVVNAIGPETFSYRNLVRMIGQAIGKNRPLLPLPPLLGYLASKPVGWLVGEENRGFGLIMSNFNGERLSMACGAMAFAMVCVEEAGPSRDRRNSPADMIDMPSVASARTSAWPLLAVTLAAADQLRPSHRARWVTALPPAVVKVPCGTLVWRLGVSEAEA